MGLRTSHSPRLVEAETVVYDFCRDYSQRPSRGRRLLLAGANGCGKTHIARRIHNYASRMAMQLPLVNVANSDGDACQLAASQFLLWPGVVDGFKRGEYGVVEDSLEASLLVLDDIGAEHDPSGIGREKLYYMLERRAQRWTVMTTNVLAKDWEVKFERRIASRFLRNCTVIDLSAVPDYGTVE